MDYMDVNETKNRTVWTGLKPLLISPNASPLKAIAIALPLSRSSTNMLDNIAKPEKKKRNQTVWNIDDNEIWDTHICITRLPD